MKSIRTKFISLFILITLIPLLITSTISEIQTYHSLKSEAFSKLVAIRDIKKSQIENYFEERFEDISILASSNDVYTSLQLFQNAYIEGVDSPLYEQAEAEYHDYFQHYIDTYGYYDLFFINMDGEIIYTVAKEDDFATNLLTGAYKDTNLAEAFRTSIQTKRTSLQDYLMYAPSNEPAAFLASPIMKDGKPVGVIALQISDERINHIMTERSGLGETGEVYIVANDYFMRSDSRFITEKTIGTKEIQTESVVSALNNETGVKTIPNYRDVTVYSAYTPLQISDLSWVLLSEVEEGEIMAPAKTLLWEQIAIIFLVIAIVIPLSIFIARKQTKPIIALAEASEKVAQGDLQMDLSISSNDEFGRLASSFEKMVGNLRKIISDVNDASINVSANAEELFASSEESKKTSEHVSILAVGAEESANKQRTELQLIDTSFQEMADGLKQIGENSEVMLSLTEQSMAVTNNGLNHINKAENQMNNILKDFNETNDQISDLHEETKKIGHITAIINEISEQTNLLALNAAIEAARAGEVGKGFAIVADEVRRLAEKTKESSHKIDVMIDTIQKQTKQVLKCSQRGVETARIGIQYSNQANEAFNVINESVNVTTGKVEEVSAAIQEISAISIQMGDAVSTVTRLAEKSVDISHESSEASQEQLVTMEEISSAAQNLAHLAESLQKSIALFKI